MKYIFLLAGRTGGPFFPLPTIAKNLNSYKPIYIGVRKSFEQKYVELNKLKIIYLPEVKLGILSFKKQKPLEILRNIFDLLVLFVLLAYSVLSSIFWLLKYKPKLIVTTGSFLAVPMIIAFRVTNFLRITNTKLTVHQQDPLPGISNKIAVKFSSFNSCVFEYTRQNFTIFKKAKVIPNPIDFDKYPKTKLAALENLKTDNPKIYEFLEAKSNKPTFLIFGGGSGAKDLNDWIVKNLDEVLKHFRVLHLSGELQKGFTAPTASNYYHLKSVIKGWESMLVLSDVILCRAGLGSITELSYLQKTAFLVPLPHSHQELNADLVKDKFFVLKQKQNSNWLNIILDKYQLPAENFEKRKLLENKLENYYQDLRGLG